MEHNDEDSWQHWLGWLWASEDDEEEVGGVSNEKVNKNFKTALCSGQRVYTS